jgi:hypothetical protein
VPTAVRRPQSRLQFAASIVALGSLVAFLAACGGSGADGRSVAKAAASSLRAGGAKVRITETATSAPSGTVTFLGTGDSNAATPRRGRLNIEFRSAQSTGVIRELLSGSSVYMISPLFRASIPAGKAWVKVDLRRAEKGAVLDIGSLSVATPSELLDLLLHAKEAKKLGSETIDGTGTTHYRATIDPKLANAAFYKPVDVWLDGSGKVRRVHVTYAKGSAQTRLTATYSGYGEGFSVLLPDVSVVYDAPPARSTGQGSSGG